MYRYCTERSIVLFVAAANQRCTYEKHLENNIKQLQKSLHWNTINTNGFGYFIHNLIVILYFVHKLIY